jgi:hypothetical protein
MVALNERLIREQYDIELALRFIIRLYATKRGGRPRSLAVW